MALQGNLTVRNGGMTYPEGATNTSTGIPIPRFRVGLLLGGDVTDGLTSVNVLNGNVICSGELDAVKFGLHTSGDHVHGTDAAMISAFFEAAKADLTVRNAAIYSKTSNGTVTENTDGTVTMTGTDPFLNVFTMTPSQYAAAVQGSEARRVYLDVPYGSYVIINIAGSGTVTDFAPGLLTKNSSGEWVDPSKNNNDDQAQSQRILFNFDPAITQVNLTTGFYLYGSVLAPNMFWQIDSNISNIYVGVDGTTVLAGANGNGTSSEFHYNPYVPPGAASVNKKVVCDTEDHSDCMTIPENTYVKVTLEEVVDKLGSHAAYELEFMLSETYQIPAISPGKYRVSEVAFYTMDESGEKQDVVIEGHSFTGATFKINGQEASGGATVYISSGSTVSIEVTNHYKEGEYTSIAVQKKWVDADGNQIVIQDDTQIQVQLYQATDRVLSPDEGTPFGDPVTLTAADGWYYQWTELPKNDGSGHHYWYFVRETSPVEGFDVEYQSSPNGYDPIQSGTYTLINKKKTEVTVKKIWKDSSGNEIEPPEGTTIEVTLYGNGKVVTQDAYSQPITNPVTLSSAEGWEHTWENLCLRDPDDISGNAINYTVTESGHPDSYTSVVTGSGYRFTITNTKKPAYEMTVSKAWTDENGSPLSGTALPAVKVQLYQLIADWSDGTAKSILDNGTAYGNPVWLSGENGWSYTWEELPKTDGDKQCYYAVKELSNIPGFTTANGEPSRNAEAGTISQTITNRRDEKLTGIAVQKQWKSLNGKYEDPPADAEVTVQLYRQLGEQEFTGGSYTVSILFPYASQTYQVQPGTELSYTIDFCHKQNATLFASEPDGYQYKNIGNTGWIDDNNFGNGYVAQITGTVTVNQNLTITFTEASGSPIYNGQAFSDWRTAYPPVITASYTEPESRITWQETSAPYGDAVSLTDGNWYHQWTNLPAQMTGEDGKTYLCRYYVLETAGPVGYDVSYTIGGKTYTIETGAAPIIPDGITEGTILITNTSTRAGVELPDTGGAGTVLYSFSGIALMAGTLMYYIRKRRKGAV